MMRTVIVGDSEFGYIESNLKKIWERIVAACTRAGRSPAEVTLVAVSKTATVAQVLAAFRAGVRHFGENRVEDALPKIEKVRAELGVEAGIVWHMIGHLQSRKVRDALPAFDLIHSVDSTRIAEHISRRLEPLGKRMPVLIEVNVTGEESKYGFTVDEAAASAGEILQLPRLDVRGLMTMAPLVEDPEEARHHFCRLRELRDELSTRFSRLAWHELSMGMTDDFEPAVEEGATLVRIGRAIFERPA